MIADAITPRDVVEVLNRILEADHAAVSALATNRVPCNGELAADPTVQVWARRSGFHVGLLGVLNGLFGVDEEGWGSIAADVENGEIVRFRLLTEEDRRPRVARAEEAGG